jgi:hypothetical protein
VSFVKNAPVKVESIAGLDDLVALPFTGNWMYKKITLLFRLAADGTYLDSLSAESDRIAFTVKGAFYRNDKVNADINIRFAKALTDKMPEELSRVVLQDDPDGWKGLSVNISGDYKSPAIQVSSKLFRLNIRSVTTP